MDNQHIASILYKTADLLDLKGENFFKIRAYRIAAQTIETLAENVEVLVKQKRLESTPGVGEALTKKITEFIETGKIEYLERLKKEIPIGLLDFLEIPGLGPKKVATLYKNFGITTIEALKKACVEGKLRTLDGFGEITERNILRGIQLREKTSGRVLLNIAYENGQRYLQYLKEFKKIDSIHLAGSLRRMKETIGDIDILASSKHPDDVMAYFVKYPYVDRVLAQGPTKSSVLLHDTIQVDLRVVEKKHYGAALLYFTGSKEHNVSLRGLAIRKGYKLNEYGLFTKKTNKYIAGKTEEEIYKTLGLSYIEPEMRENHGEIEAAKKHKLPNLVQERDIHGDFHIHSLWSDGIDTLETLADAAQKLGYSFMGSTDHSQSLKIANGLSEENLQKKLLEIQKLNKKYKDFRILFGTECDIKSDGSLDYSNKILKQFDFVYAGIHTGFKMNKTEMTKRIIKGIENEHVDFFAHPTGRLIGKRDPYEVDIEQIIDTAKETGTFLEINAFPDRLDLDDIHAHSAKKLGVRFVLGTDSHSVSHLPFMRFGVATARRGWLEKKDILNTHTLKEIEKLLRG